MSSNSNAPAPKEHRTVSRVTAILELVAEREGAGLGQIVEHLDAAKSSVHGLVKGLEAVGYLREENGGYRLGPAVNLLLAPAGPSLERLVRPAMEELRDEFDESVVLGTLVGSSVVYVHVVESKSFIRYSPPKRTRMPLYPASIGKCFLAWMSERRREDYLRETISDKDRRKAVREELAEVRRRGFATNQGETIPDISAVASPILASDRVSACLSIAGPSNRLSPRLEEAAAAVCRATAQFSTD